MPSKKRINKSKKSRNYITQRKRINKSKSMKQKGGITNNDIQTLLNLGFSQDDIQYLIQNNGDIDVTYFQNAVNSVPNNPFFSQPRSPQQIMDDLRNINAINYEQPVSLDNNLEEGNTDSEYSSLGFGGKNKRSRRTSKRSRVTSKRGKKVSKTKKYKKGGNGFTTSEDTMIEEDDKLYKEMNELAFPKK